MNRQTNRSANTLNVRDSCWSPGHVKSGDKRTSRIWKLQGMMRLPPTMALESNAVGMVDVHLDDCAQEN